jgi:hypothetical protein
MQDSGARTMKAAVSRYFNDIISIVMLTLMALALVAGQSVATGHEVEKESVEPLRIVIEVRS